MSRKAFFLTTISFALTLAITSILFDVPLVVADDDPRSDIACDKMVVLESKQDHRGDYDSNIPDSDIGSQKAFEGALKAMGDCPF